tara:strand:- start:315 stop:635 length:321 start_codon:yes stop_codon:yes gene_type:complete
MDKNHDGKISISELKQQNSDQDIKQLLCMLLKHDAENPDLNDIITDDGCIDFNELVRINDSEVFPSHSIFKLHVVNGKNDYLLDSNGDVQIEAIYRPFYSTAETYL